MESAKPTKVLVTGGAGFIGSRLTKRLLKEGYSVTVVDDLSVGSWKNLPSHPKLKKIKASVLDDLSSIIKKQTIIFHLAAIPLPQISVADPLLTHQVNLNATLNLLHLARLHDIQKFIFASSYTVYPTPLVPYSLQKLASEEYCRLYYNLYGLNTLCLRYFNVYGPGMNYTGQHLNLIPKFVNMLLSDQPPTINGDGQQSRDFIHVDDVVNATIMAANSPLSGKTFNVNSGRSVSINQVLRHLNKLLGKKIKPVYLKAPPEPKVAKPAKANISKLPGWKAVIKFKAGLQTILPK